MSCLCPKLVLNFGQAMGMDRDVKTEVLTGTRFGLREGPAECAIPMAVTKQPSRMPSFLGASVEQTENDHMSRAIPEDILASNKRIEAMLLRGLL